MNELQKKEDILWVTKKKSLRKQDKKTLAVYMDSQIKFTQPLRRRHMFIYHNADGTPPFYYIHSMLLNLLEQ